MFLREPHGPPEHGEGELGQGVRIIFGVLRDVRLAVLSIRAHSPVYRVALGISPAEDGVLVGLPRQLVQLLHLLPQTTQGGDQCLIVGGQRALKEEGIRQRQPPSGPTEQGPHPLLI